MSNELFEADEAKAARSQAMNRMIVGQRNAKQTFGTLGRTSGQTTPSNEQARERLSQALGELESAKRSGDADRLHYAEFLVERATASSEAARTEDRPRDDLGRFIDTFDGGVRGRGVAGGVNSGNRLQESANSMFKHAIQRSREESAESTEQTVIAANT